MWKSINIKGFENYVVSNNGRIINTKNVNEIKGWKNKQGYQRVHLTSTEGFRKKFYVHRLVAIVFHGFECSTLEVHHVNGNRYDNNYENLQWVTRQQNMEYVHNKLTVDEKINEEEDLPF